MTEGPRESETVGAGGRVVEKSSGVVSAVEGVVLSCSEGTASDQELPETGPVVQTVGTG